EQALGHRAAVLAGAIATFSSELRAHLAAEEELLGPVLERIDAWGPVRLDLLRTEHAHQRAVLDASRTDRRLDARDIARRPQLLGRLTHEPEEERRVPIVQRADEYVLLQIVLLLGEPFAHPDLVHQLLHRGARRRLSSEKGSRTVPHTASAAADPRARTLRNV